MNRIFALADLHGESKWLRKFKNYMETIGQPLDSTDTIVLLGDTGLNFFFNERDVENKKKFNEIGCNLFLIRGNHEQRPSIVFQDNPMKWHMEEFFGNLVYVEDAFPSIKYALDTIAYYNLHGYKTLVCPGAYSVDKYYRLAQGWSWFEDEQLTNEEWHEGFQYIQKENPSCRVDIVLSHAAPSIYVPSDLFLPTVDQSLVDDSTERKLGVIEQNVRYRLWLWGHYHKYRKYPLRGDSLPLMLFNSVAINIDEVLLDPYHFTPYVFA